MSKSTPLFLGLLLTLALLVGVPVAFAQDGDAEDVDPTETEPIDLGLPDVGYTVTGDNSYCLVCHTGLGDTEAEITWQQVDASTSRSNLASLIHATHVGGEDGAACLDCHPADIFPHDEPRLVGEGLEAAASYTDSCIGCHHENADQIEGACSTCHDTTYVMEADTAVLNVAVGECEQCHPTTVTEWQNSEHGTQQLGCDSCHFPHQGVLRFGDEETLCLNCHDQSRDEYVHVTHVEQTCSDCHIYQGFDQTFHVLTGGQIQDTGHHNNVTTAACTDCHSEVQIAADDDGEIIEVAALNHPLVQARLEIEALEEEIAETRETREEESARLLVQALILGLALGAVVVLIGLRLVQRRLSAPPSDASD